MVNHYRYVICFQVTRPLADDYDNSYSGIETWFYNSSTKKLDAFVRDSCKDKRR
jgi:hypothetical protein